MIGTNRRGIGLKLIAAIAVVTGFSLGAAGHINVAHAQYTIYTYNVNTTYDGPLSDDITLGDGICDDQEVPAKCSLRAATEESNYDPYNSLTYINVPVGTYTLLPVGHTSEYLYYDGYQTYLQGPNVGPINPPLGALHQPKVIIDGSMLDDGNQVIYADSYGLAINYITITGGSGIDGGCVYNEYTMSLSNDWIHDCGIGNVVGVDTAATPYTTYGGGFENDDNLTSLNTWLQRNHAEYGGGLYTDDNTVMSGGQVTDNTADYSGYGEGGGAYNEENLQMTNVQVLRNDAGGTTPGDTLFNADGYGGGIYNYYYLQFNNGSIGNGGSLGTLSTNGNVAGYEGGGIYTYDEQSVVTNSTINGNMAGYDGGGLYDDDEYEFYSGDTFSFNSAGGMTSGYTGYGGAMDVEYVANFSNSVVSYNAAYDATTGPKALAVSTQAKSFNRRANHIVAASVFHASPRNPTAPKNTNTYTPKATVRPVHSSVKALYTYGGYGGGVYTDGSYCSWTNVYFHHNFAYDGGAFYDDYCSYDSFQGSNFLYNHADDDGGAYFQASGDIPVNFSTGKMQYNSAGYETGGLYDYDSYYFLANQFIISNNTDTFGCPNLAYPCS